MKTKKAKEHIARGVWLSPSHVLKLARLCKKMDTASSSKVVRKAIDHLYYEMCRR